MAAILAVHPASIPESGVLSAQYALPLIEIFHRFWHSDHVGSPVLNFAVDTLEGGFLETNNCLGYICPHFEWDDMQRGKAHNLSKQIYLRDA
jgi:hypothetical protein